MRVRIRNWRTNSSSQARQSQRVRPIPVRRLEACKTLLSLPSRRQSCRSRINLPMPALRRSQARRNRLRLQIGHG